MAPPKTGKGATKDKKEKLFHPQSRKAGQLVRTQFRKTKLSELARARSKKQGSQSMDDYCTAVEYPLTY